MVAIRPVIEVDLDSLPEFRVTEEQESFVSSSLREYFDETQIEREAGLLVPFLIELAEQPVGFFALRFDLARARDYVPAGEKAVVLLNFFIAREGQGRGYASEALSQLPSCVRARYPQIQSIYLTVNVRNEAAQRTYLRAGYQDTGRLYLGGLAGPQKVYLFSLVEP